MIEDGILNLYTLNFLERIGEGLYFVLSLFEITATVSSNSALHQALSISELYVPR